MSTDQSASAIPRVDPRGPRFGAAITSVVLILVLSLWGFAPVVSIVLLALQAVVFALGAGLGVARQPYGLVFRSLVRPRLQPPAELEDARPPRFAQLIGLIFAVVGLVGALAGLSVVFSVAVGFALVAALLNAVFDFCLGCELYLLGKRLGSRQGAAA